MLMLAALLLLSVAAPPPVSGREHVGLSAAFEHSGSGPEGDVVIRFMPLDAPVQVNAEPAARLTLDLGQRLLHESSRPAPPVPRQPFPNARYVDTRVGVRFPVRLAPGTRGRHTLHASLTYFYCSTTEGWCRRAQDDVEIELNLP
jgi:hypothetical protein